MSLNSAYPPKVPPPRQIARRARPILLAGTRFLSFKRYQVPQKLRNLVPFGERGFTLMEALLSVTLIAIISLSAVSVFSLGLQIWKRTRQVNNVERKAVLALEKMGTDLRSAVQIAPVKDSFSIQDKTPLEYKGSSVQMMIPSVVMPQGPKDPGGYARKTYRWNSSKRELCRSIEKAAELFRKSTPACEVIAKNVTKFKLRYRLPSGLSGSYSWYDDWDGKDGLPLSVQIDMEIAPDGGFEKKIFNRIIVIPSAGSSVEEEKV